MVRISDTFHPANGMPVAPVESITLAVYREEVGGTPLWQETQNVTVDAEGHYTALMGSTLNEGIPLDLFRSAEPRWLGVQFNRPGETEQPRRRLASVPYALKASDAETLGGRPASAYLLDPNVVGNGSGNSAGSTPAALPDAKSLKPRQTTSGTMNYLPYFLDNSSDLGNSTVYQNGINVGVGTTAPARKLDLVDASSVFQMRLSTGSNEGGLGADGNGFFRMVGTLGSALGTGSASQGTFNEVMRIINGRVGIGTTAPARKLDLVDATSVFQMRFSTGSNEGGFGSDPNGFFRVVGTLGGAFGTGSASQGTFNEVMRIVNGNLGIGTTAPSAPLEVAGNLKISGTGHSLMFPDGTQQTTAATSGGLSGGGRTNYLPLWTGSSTLGYSSLYQLNGNVGLGTTAPSAPLEVAGNLKISGTGHSLTFPDGTQQTTAAT
ncbi:MAG: hypothetical protein JOZ22_15815, partial [Acidobacteriia bacterium]|nr:hypothetical protein [Terriglobia bacterium]